MRRVLLVPLLVLAIAAVAVFGYVTTTLRRASADLERQVESVRRANILASRLSQLSTDTTRGVLAYRIRPTPEGAATLEALSDETDRIVAEVSRLDLSPRGRAIWRQLVATRDLRTRERERLVRAVDRGDAAQSAVLLDRWTLASDKATALTGDFSVFNLKRLTTVTTQHHQARSRAQAWLFVLLGAAALAIVAFAVLVDRWLVRPVQAVTRTARHIADERVALRVPGCERTDELGLLARTVMEMAARFVHANAELARSVETRDEFLSLAAHELRTPLAALKLHLQACHRTWVQRSLPPSVPFVETALRHAGRIETLIGDLLLFAEIRTGRFTIERQRTNLSALVDEVVHRFRDVMAHSRNGLESAISPNVSCECDAMCVGRVVTNLLANAAEHAPGTLVSVRLETEGATHVIDVEDGGPGIPRTEWALVFEPYRKGGRTERVRGLGLGLFIAKQIVEAHGGSIAVAAGARGGTRFRVELPAGGVSPDLHRAAPHGQARPPDGHPA